MFATPATKVQLYRVRINSQGYSSDGRYYGVGMPVYLAHDDEDFTEEFRAYDREDAKEILKEKYPSIKFYR